MTTVTVVIPTYNRPEFVREAIASVQRQTVQDVEIIVVDDFSTEPVAAALAASPATRAITVIRHSENRGPGEGRRTGVAAAKSPFIAFLDDDDVTEPQWLETALGVLANDASIGMFCCDGLLVDQHGRPAPTHDTFNGAQARIHGYRLATGARSLADVFLCPTIGIGFVVRQEVFARVNYPAGRWLEDYRFQLEVAGSGFTVHYEHQALAHYRMHATNASAPSPAMCAEMLDCLEDVRRRFPSLGEIGWRGRQRLAQARMEFAVACLRDRRRWQGVKALGRSILEYPAQALVLARMGQRKLVKHA